MFILFADSVDESRLASLETSGHSYTIRPELSADDLPSAIADYDALVVRSTRVTAETIGAANKLSLIVRAGAGTDNIDISAASRAGIHVCNVPGRNAVAVAELALGLLLSIDRRIADNCADLRSGTWNKGIYSIADGLKGQSVGIVGLGEIGLAVAERAKAFGMTVVALRKTDRSESVANRIRSIGIRLVDSLDHLLGESDIVSIHVPKGDTTSGLVDSEFLAKMKDRAILINTSRGDMVDEIALIEAMNTRGIRAGLDVYQGEPSTKSDSWKSELASHPNVVGTHHIGASTSQAQASVADGVVETLLAFSSGDPLNCVNLVTEPLGAVTLTIRHDDKVGVLAKIFESIRSNGVNVQQMSNRVFIGGGAAIATMELASPIDDELVSCLADIEEVFQVTQTLIES